MRIGWKKLSLEMGIRDVICAPSLRQDLQKRYPRRKIWAEVYCPDWEYYYIGANDRIHTVRDRHIWEAILDHDGWPTGFLKKIR